jgi:uncharacterized protein YoaH (UPF0181 family)
MPTPTEERSIKEDMTLFRRSVRGQWNVTKEIKQKAVEQIGKILNDRLSSDKTIIEAIKTAAVLDTIDLKEYALHVPKKIERINDRPTAELLSKVALLLGGDPSFQPMLIKLKERLLPALAPPFVEQLNTDNGPDSASTMQEQN